MILRKARQGDLADVLRLYRSVLGRPGCTWTEEYPAQEEIDYDFGHDSLFVLCEEDAVIGAASVVPDNELDELDCWRLSDGSQREIARIVIAPERQGRGCAKAMLSMLFSIMRKNGCSAVHLLAAKENPAAVRTYQALGFAIVGECFTYGHDYFAMEMKL